MEILYQVPNWFFAYGLVFQILFAVVTLMVSVYAFNIYKISKERKVKLFGFAFLFISMSYIFWPLIGFFATLPIEGALVVLFENLGPVSLMLVYAHIIFFLLGLGTLVYSALEEKNNFIYGALVALSIIPVLVAVEKSNITYVISSVLLFFTFFHHCENYAEKKKKGLIVMGLAFFLLFLATLVFIFSDTFSTYYVVGHFLMFAAYLLILGRLFYTKNGKKKR